VLYYMAKRHERTGPALTAAPMEAVSAPAPADNPILVAPIDLVGTHR